MAVFNRSVVVTANTADTRIIVFAAFYSTCVVTIFYDSTIESAYSAASVFSINSSGIITIFNCSVHISTTNTARFG